MHSGSAGSFSPWTWRPRSDPPPPTTTTTTGISSPAVIRETFSIEIVMQDVRVSLSLFVGANSGTLFGILLGSIARAENVWTCLLTIVDDAKITELVVAADVEAPVLRGLDDPVGGTGYLIKCSRCTGGSCPTPCRASSRHR